MWGEESQAWESEDWDKEGKKKGTVERRHEEDGDDTDIQHRKRRLLSGLGSSGRPHP